MKKNIYYTVAFLLTFLVSNNILAKDFYWIGGSGKWNDAQHWSFTSGGVSANQIPGKKDKATFEVSRILNISFNEDISIEDLQIIGNGALNFVGFSNPGLFINKYINKDVKVHLIGSEKLMTNQVIYLNNPIETTNQNNIINKSSLGINSINNIIDSSIFVKNVTCGGSCDGKFITNFTTDCGGTIEIQYIGGDGSFYDKLGVGSGINDTVDNLCKDGEIFTIVVYECGDFDNPYVYDNNGNGYQIGGPGVILLFFSPLNASVSCYGGCNGTYNSITVSGGNTPVASYTYSWSASSSFTTIIDNTKIPTHLCAGKNYVKTTDNKGCTKIDSVTISTPTEIVATVTPIHPLCNGDANGSATASAVGGTGALSYTWYNSTHTNIGTGTTAPTNLVAGDYSLVVRDTKFCTDSVPFSLINPTAVTSTSVNDSTSCYGMLDGEFNLTTGGGTQAYTYTIVPDPLSVITNPTPTTGNISGLPAGPYVITVTDANGCDFTLNDTIYQPLDVVPVGLATPDTVCEGFSTTLTATSNLATVTYTWNDGTADVGNGTPLVQTPLVTITYTLTATNTLNSCTGDTTFTVVVNPLPNIVTDPAYPPLCSNDGAGVTITALPGTLTYTWTPSGGLNVTTGNVVVVTQSVAGTYTYTVQGTDNFGCIDTNIISVTVNPPPFVNVSAVTTLKSCEGVPVDLTATIGGLQANFHWDVLTNNATPDTISSLGVITSTHTFDPTGSADGDDVTVQVIAQNSSSCFDTTTIIIDVVPRPTITATAVDDELCAGECTNITGGGAGAGGSYSWYTLAPSATNPQNVCPLINTTYSVTGTDANGCSNDAGVDIAVNALPDITTDPAYPPLCSNDGTGIVITASPAGLSYVWTPNDGSILPPSGSNVVVVTLATPGVFLYTATGTDAFGCSDTEIVTVTVTLPPVLVVTPSTQISCNGVPVDFSATIGGSAADFDWTVTSANATPASISENGVTTSNQTFDPTGTLETDDVDIDVIAIDANGCMDTVTVNIDVKPSPTITANATDATLCVGECTDITGGGAGVGGTYSWHSLAPSATNPQNVCPIINTTYSVTGTDANGCSDSSAVSIAVNPLPDITTDPAYPPLCSNEGAGVVITASPAGLSYVWTPNDGTIIPPSGSNIVTVTSATPGVFTYVATGTDAFGCVDTEIVTVTVNPPPIAVINPNAIISCNGVPVDLTATIGGSVATFTWLATTSNATFTPDNEIGVTSSTSSVNPTALTDVIVNVYATDINGCTDTATATIDVRALPTVVASANPNAICEGTCTTINAAGAFTYSWLELFADPSLPSQSVCPTTDTVFTVEGTDTFGCKNTDTANVLVNPKPDVQITSVDTICFNASLTLTGSGATTYNWYSQTGGFGTLLSAANTYIVTATITETYTLVGFDGLGCSDTTTKTIVVSSPPVITSAFADPSHICKGASSSLNATSAGNTFDWAEGVDPTGLGSPLLVTPLTAGTHTYTVTATNSSGCTATDTAILIVEGPPIINPNDATVCEGNCADLDAGAGYTSYNWVDENEVFHGISQTINVCPLVTTDYSVTVTSPLGCTNTGETTVNVNIVIPVSTGDKEFCLGGSTTLLASSTGIGVNYTWTGPGGMTPGDGIANPITISGLLAGSYTYTVTGIDTNGCSNTDEAIVTVHALPTITTSGNAPICNGACTDISANGAVTYDWFENGIFDQSGQTINVCPAASATYSVVGTDGNTCQSSSTLAITVNALPTANAGNDTSVCFGGSISLNGSGGGTYSWTPSTYLFPDNTASPLCTPTTDISYTLTVTDVNGCKDEDYMDVTVHVITPVASLGDTVCDGATLQLSASPTGGTVVWSPIGGLDNANSFTPIATVTGFQIYTATITDVNGCIGTDTTYVQANDLDVLGVVVPPSACGTNDAKILIDVTGGLPSYDYQWSGASVSTDEDLLNIIAGNYTLTVTDQMSCSKVVSFNVADPAAFVVTGVVTPPATCGGSDGSIDVTLVGIVVAPTYSWHHDASTGEDVSGLGIGTYTVTVLDGPCTAVQSFTITDPASTNPNAGVNDTICVGETITLTGNLNGGSNPLWTPGGAGISINVSPLVNTAYVFSVTDANGCPATDTVMVIVNTLPTVSAGADQNACEGSQFNLSANGVGIVSYVWSTPAGLDDANISNPTLTLDSVSVTKVVTGTDANGCTDTDDITITVSPIKLSIDTNGTSNCGLSDGSIDLTVTGGFPGFTYLWMPNNKVTEDISDLAADVYSVTVTDLQGCEATIAGTVNEPVTFSHSAVITDVISCGATNGAINLTIIGGTNPVATWTLPDLTTVVAEDLNGLEAGTYTVSITDDFGCTAAGSYDVEEPTATDVSTSPDQTICFGGTAAVSANPAASGTYSWTGGLIQSGAGSANAVLNPNATTTYEVFLTDVNGCTDSAEVTITVSNPVITMAVTNVSVCGGIDGSITAGVSGAVFPFSYSWSPGAHPDAPTINGLSTGPYEVEVTDAIGCKGIGRDTVNDPSNIVFTGTAVIDPTTCTGNDGAINLVISGGTAPYHYVWNPAAADSPNNTNLTAGTYSVTVTDTLNCTKTTSFTVTDPTPVQADAGPDVTICEGQTIALNSTNIAPPIVTFNWTSTGNIVSGQGTASINVNPTVTEDYILTTTDTINCVSTDTAVVFVNATPALTVATSDPLICVGGTATLTATAPTATSYSWYPAAGLGSVTSASTNAIVPTPTFYNVLVIDANGCSNLDSVQVNVGTQLSISSTYTNPTTCAANDGTITLTVNDGSGSYDYAWTPAQANQPNISGLNSGAYSVTVTDQTFGCNDTAMFVLTAPNAPTLDIVEIDAVTCGDTGTLDLTINGGTQPYTILWSNASPSEDITAVAGTYSVTVTDAASCVASAFGTISSPITLQVDAGADQNLCNGNSTSLSASGSVNYVWNNPDGTMNPSANVPNPFVTPTVTTNYIVTATDQNGCTSSDTVTVFVGNMFLSAAVTDVTNCGGDNGAINLTVNGDFAPYTFVWLHDGSLNEDIVGGLEVGSYQVIVTDNAFCKDTLVAEVATTNPGFVATITGTNPANCGDLNGIITYSPNTAAYAITFNGGVAPASPATVTAGFYNVVITDIATGCEATEGITITSTIPTQVFAGSDFFNCGQSFTLSALPAGMASYSWDTLGGNVGVGQSVTVNNLTSATMFTVTAVDANGCTTKDSVIVTPADLDMTFVLTSTSGCGANDGNVDVTVTGGTGAYTYTINGDPTIQDPVALIAGQYKIIVTDVLSGCMDSVSFNINDPGAFLGTFTKTSPSTCGGCDGILDLGLSGGTLPYVIDWADSPDTDTNHTDLCAGPYSVTVTDGIGCTKVFNDTLSDPTPSVISAGIDQTICGGTSTTISATAGFNNYNWTANPALVFDNTSNNPSVNPVSTTEFIITAKDAKNCDATDTMNVNVDVITLNTLIVHNDTCNGVSGQVTTIVTGGVSPIVHSWSSGQGNVDVITGLSSGPYTDTVTDSLGCAQQITAIVNDPVGFWYTATITQPQSCVVSDGVIAVTAIGASNPKFVLDEPAPAGGPNFTVSGGNHTITITDDNLCSLTFDTTLNVPAVTTPVDAGNNLITCSGDSVTLRATPTNLVSYVWTVGAAIQGNADTLVTAPVITTVYTVTATDINGCESIDSVTVTPNSLTITMDSLDNPSSCSVPNGKIYTTISGSGNYTITWDGNTVASEDGVGLAAGFHTIVVTDNTSGCIDSVTVALSDTVSYTVNFTKNNPTTCNGTDGSLIANVIGVTGPYDFDWTNSTEASNTLSNIGAGGYEVLVSDAGGCVLIVTDTLVDPTPTQVDAGSDTIICGGSTITITATPSAAGAYLWSGGSISGAANQATVILNPSVNTTYQVQLTDAKNCVTTDNININVNTIALTTTVTNNDSCANNNGQILVNIVGGIAPITHSWSNSTNVNPAIDLVSAIYTDTVTDNMGCVQTISDTVIDPIPFTYSAIITEPTRCDVANGIIDITTDAIGAQYLLGLVPVTEPINVNGGTYTITIEDQNNCKLVFDTTLTNPTVVQVSAGNDTSICLGSTVTLTATPAGLSNYDWLDLNTMLSVALASQTANVTPLVITNYEVTATDNNGCTSTDTVMVTPFTLSFVIDSTNDVSTCGGADGETYITISDGSGNYTTTWEDGITIIDRTDLSAGVHTLTVTDNVSGCLDSVKVTINSPASFNLALSVTDPTKCDSKDGQATVVVTGTTQPYTYTWSDGLSAGDSVRANLDDGEIIVTVKDIVGCVLTATDTLYNPSTVSVIASNDSTICNGSTLALAASNGYLSYSWTATPALVFSNTDQNPNVSPLANTQFIIEAFDFKNCPSTDTVVVSINSFTLSTTVTNNDTCADNEGSVLVNIVGGVLPFTHSWNNGATVNPIDNLLSATYTDTVTDNLGCKAIISASVSDPLTFTFDTTITNASTCNTASGLLNINTNAINPIFTVNGDVLAGPNFNLPGGTHAISITDAGGCTAAFSVTIDTPSVTLVNAGNDVFSCSGESLTLTATPAGFSSYNWSDGTLTFVGETINVSPVLTTTYTLSAMDANGCTSSDMITVTPGVLTTTLDSVDNVSSCSVDDGCAYLSIVGSGNYIILWDGIPGTATKCGLSSGAHEVIVSDNVFGCSDTIQFGISSPVDYSVSITKSNPTECALNNGSLLASVTGGTGPFTFTWLSQGVSTPLLDNRPAGTYTVVVSDAGGCDTTLIDFINDPVAIQVDAGADQTICFGNSTTISATVGFGSYTWTANPTTSFSTFQNSPLVTPNVTTLFTVVAKDVNNCTSTDSVLVRVNKIGLDTTLVYPAICGGVGSITVIPSGGVSPYIHNWSDSTTATILVPAGTYTDTVTDALGCMAIITASVSDPASFTETHSITNPTKCATSNGLITVTTTATTPAYTYDGTSGLTPPFLADAGTHSVIITEGACSIAFDVTLVDPTPIQVDAGSDIILCTGLSQAVNISATDFTEALWSPDNSTDLNCINCLNQTITVNSTQTYVVTATDKNNCLSYDTLKVFTSDLELAAIDFESGCGLATGSIDLSVLSGTGNYTYTWSPNTSNSEDVSGLAAGMYSVTVNDLVSKCSEVLNVTVDENAQFTLTSFAANTTKCNGNDGVIDLTVGGIITSPTYTWTGPNAFAASSEDVSGLTAGVYTVEVKDAGCKRFLSDTISDPAKPAVNAGRDTVICLGNNIQLKATSGFVEYTWSPTSNLLPNEFAYNPIVTPIASDNYIVQVIDANNCKNSDTVNVTIDAIAFNSGITDPIKCGEAQGVIEITPTSGTAPYTYSWTDAVVTTEDRENLVAGVYVVHVKDNIGCSDTLSFAISDPTPFTVDNITVVDQTTCGGTGTITLSISGGATPYVITNVNTNAVVANPITGLTVGLQAFEIVDANGGCVKAIAEEIKAVVGTQISVGNDVSICAGNATTLTASQTTGTFSWTPTTDLSSATISTVSATPTANVAYTLYYTDTKNCTSSDTVSVSVTDVTLASSTLIDVTNCFINDGKVDITIAGGTTPYTYNWTGVSSNQEDLTDLAKGIYAVTVTENSPLKCNKVFSFEVKSLAPLEVNAGEDVTFCSGNGPFLLKGSGATNYSWYVDGVSQQFSIQDTVDVTPPLGITTYKLLAFTGLCVDSDYVTINMLVSPTADAGNDVELLEGNPELIGGNPTSSTANVTYSWVPAADLDDATKTKPLSNVKVTTTYTVYVTDTSKCISIDTMQVKVFPVIKPPDGISPNGDGVNDTWIIDFINKYPEAIVQVFNRWGQLLFESAKGYPDPWDGKYNGKDLPVGTYYYVINLNDSKVKPYTGPITILR